MNLPILLLWLGSAVASPFAIENTTVHLGDGTVLENTTVVVAAGRIQYVGNQRAPQIANRIDGTGKVLTPGFIEVNCPMGLVEVSAVGYTNDTAAGEELFSPAFKAAEGFNPHSVRIPLAREGGVTQIQITSQGGILSGQGFFANMTGGLQSRPNLQKPTVYSASASRGAVEKAGGSRGAYWLKLRQLFTDARYYLSNKRAVARGESRELSAHPTQLSALKPLLLGKAPLLLEVHRASDILAAIEFAQAQKMKLVVLGGTEAWMVVQALKAAQIPVVLRPSQQAPTSFERLAARDDLPAYLNSKGVEVLITAGGWFLEVHRLRQEAGIAVANGLPYGDAMRAITSLPARIFGLGHGLGSIKKGKRADLVLWSSDPFENHTLAENMWIQGVSQSLETRQRKLAKRYLQNPSGVAEQDKN